jgi:ELWxxDGT repeat protein
MNFRNPLTRILLVGKFLTCLAFGESFQQLKDINTVPFESSSSPQFFKTSGPSSFFVASTVEHGSELWITTGTEAGIRLVKDINLGAPSSGISSVSTFLNGTFLFFADDGIHGSELWRSDGTTEGATPFSPPSGLATGSLNGLNPKSKFLAFIRSNPLFPFQSRASQGILHAGEKANS